MKDADADSKAGRTGSTAGSAADRSINGEPPPTTSSPGEFETPSSARVDKPKLTDGIELLGEHKISAFKESAYLVRLPDGQMVQLTRPLYLITLALDGQRDVGEIAREVSKQLGESVSTNTVASLIERKLRPLGLLADLDRPALDEAPLTRPLLVPGARGMVIPEEVVRAVTVRLRSLFLRPVAIVVVCGLVALNAWLFFIHGIGQGVREAIYEPLSLLLIFGLTLVSAAFHEFGQATACHYSGVKPGAINLGLYLLWPIFYKHLNEPYRASNSRLLGWGLGGFYFNAILTLLIAAIYFLSGFEPLIVALVVLQIRMVAQFLPVLVSFDGSYVLTGVTGVRDLLARVKSVLLSLVPGREPQPTVTELKPWVRLVVTGWVFITLLALLAALALLIIGGLRLVALIDDSLLLHADRLLDALEAGATGTALLVVMEMLTLALVPIAIILQFGRRPNWPQIATPSFDEAIIAQRKPRERHIKIGRPKAMEFSPSEIFNKKLSSMVRRLTREEVESMLPDAVAKRPDAPNSEPHDDQYIRFTEEVADIIRSAKEWAENLKQTSEQEAEAARARATEQAGEILAQANREAEAKLRSAHQEAQRFTAESEDAYRRASERVEKMIREAEEDAEAKLAEARQKAEQLTSEAEAARSRATERAEEIVRQAHTEASTRLKTAWEKAENVIAKAQKEAQELRDAAARECKELVEGAKRQRQRLKEEEREVRERIDLVEKHLEETQAALRKMIREMNSSNVSAGRQAEESSRGAQRGEVGQVIQLPADQ